MRIRKNKEIESYIESLSRCDLILLLKKFYPDMIEQEILGFHGKEDVAEINEDRGDESGRVGFFCPHSGEPFLRERKK